MQGGPWNWPTTGYSEVSWSRSKWKAALAKLTIGGDDLVIIETHKPISGKEVCKHLEEVMENVKKNDNLIILGDWNAVVGEGQEVEAVGKYGLGVRNNRRQRLIDFCMEKELTNTIFQQHPRRWYTWVKPGDTARYQIDYIMVKKKSNTDTTKQNVPWSWYIQWP